MLENSAGAPAKEKLSERVVVCRIVGGLGSQLHKYALGRALAIRLDAELLLDLRYLGSDPKGPEHAKLSALADFPVRARAATSEEIMGWHGARYALAEKLLDQIGPYLRPLALLRALYRRRDRLSGFTILNPRIHHGTTVDFEKTDEKSLPMYLGGEYGIGFEPLVDLREELLIELLPETPLGPTAQAIRDSMNELPAIGVHVRRGDFVREPIFVTQNADFYIDSLRTLTNAVKEDHQILVFTDDPVWTNVNVIPFAGKNTHIVLATEPYEDFFLMTQCTALVTSNSGFSTMAAWVSGLPSERVIAPSHWFHQHDLNERQLRQLPTGWASRDYGSSPNSPD
jgi:hypothetical protein